MEQGMPLWSFFWVWIANVCHCVRVAFSIHRLAYVASRTFLSGLKVEMPLISPMVPMEIKSSWSPDWV